MLWKEVKTWCKDQGFKTDRTKIVGEENSYHYTWHKISNPEISGTATSVSKLACIVYNLITDNLHLEYQENYKKQLEETDIIHEQDFGFR